MCLTGRVLLQVKLARPILSMICWNSRGIFPNVGDSERIDESIKLFDRMAPKSRRLTR